MAERALEELESHLSCSICHHPYSNPIVLQCQHTFCLACLVVTPDKLSVICQEPGCSQVTPTPVKGVMELPHPTYVSRLLDILETFRAIVSSPVQSCPTHHEECKVYCLKCKKLFCSYCGMKGGKHYGHKFSYVNESFTQCKEEFSQPLESVTNQESRFNTALSKIDARRKEVDQQCSDLEETIRSTMKGLRETLLEREDELLGSLNQITQRKLGSLETQRRQLETTQAQLGSCIEVVNKTVSMGKEGAVLEEKRRIKNQLGGLERAFEHERLPPAAEADLEFAFKSISTECESFGGFYTSSIPNADKCYLLGKGIEEVVLGEPSTVLLQLIDYHGEPFKGHVNSIEFECVSETVGTKTVGTVKQKKGHCGQYKIGYLTEAEGKHLLHIKVEGQPINGSPFTVHSQLSSARTSQFAGPMATCFRGGSKGEPGGAFVKLNI